MTTLLRDDTTLGADGVRRLTGDPGSPDHDALTELLAGDAVGQCYLGDRIGARALHSSAVGGPIWGWVDRGEVRAAVFCGANLTGVGLDAEARTVLLPVVQGARRGCSAIVGHADEVLGLWSQLEPVWGPARNVRGDQPLMVIGSTPAVPCDPRVRIAGPSEVGAVLPAAIHMFTGEVGVSPILPGREAASAAAFRARLSSLIRQGRVFIATDEDSAVIFKAEVAAMSFGVGQLQGVWVHPDLRGKGLAAGFLAGAVALVRRTLCRTVSLYVNRYNSAALAAYTRVGFEQVGTFATVHL